MKHKIITTAAQWQACNRPYLIRLILKICALVVGSLLIGAAFAWYY